MSAGEEDTKLVKSINSDTGRDHYANGSRPFFLCRREFAKKISLGLASALLPSFSAIAQQSSSDGYAPNSETIEQIKPQTREVLLQYGTFYTHPVYGEIWVPSKQTVPQGWHPYPPCHWVNTRKLGWYFDDKTAWGAIVHHYGRWKNDTSYGWFWVPGVEFSPGWVLWRSNNQYVGWMPMPPDQDIKNSQGASVESTDSWLFMEVNKFSMSCEAALPSTNYPVILRETKFITQVRNANGIIVYELPQYIEGQFIDINIAFDPWPMWFFTQFIWFVNWIWQNTIIHNVETECWPPGNNGLVPGPGANGNNLVPYHSRHRSRRR